VAKSQSILSAQKSVLEVLASYTKCGKKSASNVVGPYLNLFSQSGIGVSSMSAKEVI
jgi:hypothetical protein